MAVTAAKPLDLIQSLSCEAVMQHLTAQLAVCGMKRNIDRRKVVAQDPVHIMIAHVGKGGVVSL